MCTSEHGAISNFQFFRKSLKNETDHLKKECAELFEEKKSEMTVLFVCPSTPAWGMTFFAKDPIIVSQFGSGHGAISDFQFFRKSLKNQNDHLKKVCDELFKIKI